MSRFLGILARGLHRAKLKTPVIVASEACYALSKGVTALLEDPEIVHNWNVKLTGRDVILIHSGETGWDEALERICQQCPGRLIVVAPVLPRLNALKIEWVADAVFIEEELFSHEPHELAQEPNGSRSIVPQ